MPVKPLEFPFNKNRFTHELIERDGLVCLVKRTSIDYGHFHLEVVELQEEPESIRFGTLVPAHERYPGNEEWGDKGFTFFTGQTEVARKRAVLCLRRVERRREGKDSGQQQSASGMSV